MLRHRLGRLAALLAGVLLSAPVWGAIQPYSPDSTTLHLWHLNESSAPCLDAAAAGTNLTALLNGASLGNSSFPGFGNALSTVDGGQDSFGGVDSDAVLTPLGVNTSAVVPYCDPATGAFTCEAIVHIEFDPAKNFGSAGGGGNGRNTPFQILNADGNANAQRIFQFRI